MRKEIILVSLIMCLVVSLSACGKKPVSEVDNTSITSSAPAENKEEAKVEKTKKEEPKKEVKKEVKQEAAKQEVQKPVAVSSNSSSSNTNSAPNKPAEQPKPAAPVTTTPTVQQPQQPVSKDEFHTLIETASPNNGKFKIVFSKTQGPAPQNVDFTIDIPSNKSFYKKFTAYAVQNDKVISFNDSLSSINDANGNKIKLKGSVIIPQYNAMPSTVDCYIVIISSDDGKTYYEKITYTITQ